MVPLPVDAREAQSQKPVTTEPHTDVFISYGSQDKAVADAVCQALERSGVPCWIAPRDVIPGETFSGAIVHGIDSTKVIVLVLSEHSAASQHVLREVERASSKRHPLIALRIDLAPMPPDLEYFLNTSQWLDASALGVERALPKLIDAVQRALAPTAVASPAYAGTTQPSAPRSFQRAPRSSPATGGWKLPLSAAGLLLTLGLGYFTWDRVWLARQRATDQPTTLAAKAVSDKSIAVLPFTDMSEKRDQEYFADGMAEEILDLLAKIPGLHVPARTSSFYFKGKSEDIPTIARRLMVANVLEGSVRKSGNHVRVTVQLVRADNGYHLWSETYDRTLDDLFKVQDDIAGETVKALKISMGTTGAPRVAPTNSPEAHSLLLQAQYWYNTATPEGLKKAISYFQQAIKIDPDFAEAWAGLSGAICSSGISPGQSGRQFHDASLRAAQRAVALDPKLAKAHLALGTVRYVLEWDWAAAHSEFEQVRLLDPEYAPGLRWAGQIAALQGRLTDALGLWEKAVARDPLDTDSLSLLAIAYYEADRIPEALTAMRKSVELLPTFPGIHGGLAQMLLAAGRKDDAFAEIKKETDPSFQAYELARTYIVLGQRSSADKALAEIEKRFSAEQPYSIATLYALRGNRDQAFSWLNRAYQQHDALMVAIPPITIESDLKNLHVDPRWNAFLRKMKLSG